MQIVLEGRPDPLPVQSGDTVYSEDALPADERARDFVLACRAQVRDDMVIRRFFGR